MCAIWICPHSCGPDIHIFLPFASCNFLPPRQHKCLQRHRWVFKVANVYWSKGRSRMPSGKVLKLASYYTPAGINSHFPPCGQLWADWIKNWIYRILSYLLFILLFWQLIHAQWTLVHWPLISWKILVKLLIWDQRFAKNNTKEHSGKTAKEMFWPFSPICCLLLHPNLSEQFDIVLFISLILL